MAGYSHKPLIHKLGVISAIRSAVLYAPKRYTLVDTTHMIEALQELEGHYDWIQAFYFGATQLEQEFSALKLHLQMAGQLWISWPKRSSRAISDLNDNIVREIGLKHGLIDVKVAAIDDTWSGIKFVYRLRDRT